MEKPKWEDYQELHAYPGMTKAELEYLREAFEDYAWTEWDEPTQVTAEEVKEIKEEYGSSHEDLKAGDWITSDDGTYPVTLEILNQWKEAEETILGRIDFQRGIDAMLEVIPED